MAFTMHSHSGEFCSHAVDTLEQVVQRAIAVGFRTIGLTEHMPRAHVEDLYPEEGGDDPAAALAALTSRYEAYLKEAQRLRDAYADRIAILVGFESEWIRGAHDDGVRIQALAAHPAIDYFIGSVHHAGPRGTPIDYDKAMYAAAAEDARHQANGALASSSHGADDAADQELALFATYYDQQLAMLQTLHPKVVGHFDLVRLLSADPGRDPQTWAAGGAALVWPKIVRNLRAVAAYGGWLECNTAALRKGLSEPYPGRAIAQEWLRLGGRFTLSDDSHGTAHVATNYRRGIAYLESLGVTEVWTLERLGEGKGGLVEKSVPLAEVSASLRLDDEPNGAAKQV